MSPSAPPGYHAATLRASFFFHADRAVPRVSGSELQGADNEGQSALWAVQARADAGVCPEAAGRVKDLVLATGHSALPATPDESLLVDVDLAILGAE